MKKWEEVKKIAPCTEVYSIGKGKNAYSVSHACIGFDIETTNDKFTKTAYMYIWQCAVNGIAYYGRTWEDFFEFSDILRSKFNGRIIILIHNMGFEMSFLLPRLYERGEIEKIFARGKYEPLSVLTTNDFEFRDSEALTNMPLDLLSKNFTTTKKMVGDLNYNKYRNSKTYLTPRELKYCENDVLILSEYAEILHKEYSSRGVSIPLTSTGIVRRMVKKSIEKRYSWVRKNVPTLFPETVKRYNFTMKYLFRGGYCHAQTAKCNEILTDVISHDLKSAYPAEMVHKLYPMTPFIPCNPQTVFEKIKSGSAVIMLCKFSEIRAKTPHVVESKHKIISEINGVYENGRLYSAEEITVLLTDVDFDIYTKFYEWENMEILQAKTAVKKPLPDYLLKPLFDVYAEKEMIGARRKTEKNPELEALYMSTKMKLNSFYGMCVSRLNLTEYDFNGEWIEIPSKTYSEEVKKAFLSPYWGIYITAYTRQTVLNAILACGGDAFYSDTDSVKHHGHDEYFRMYNDYISKINDEMCTRRGLNPQIYHKLGMFEFECVYDRFKTLGAKRYITQIGKKVECTVAGLPKKTFQKFVNIVGDDEAFEEFTMNLTFEISGKNAHQYGGECHSLIDGEEMHELGFCYIFSVPFKMSIEQSFIECVYERKKLDEQANT